MGLWRYTWQGLRWRARRRLVDLRTERLHGYRWRRNRDIDHTIMPGIRFVVAVSKKGFVNVNRFPGQQPDAMVEGDKKFFLARDVGLEQGLGIYGKSPDLSDGMGVI